METAILSATISVLITQVFRQLLPNLFAFTWQAGLSHAMPRKYLGHFWFTDKESLFYKKEGSIALTKYPLLAQSNLRAIVLLFGLIFAVCFYMPLELKDNWQALESLYLVAIILFIGVSSIVEFMKGRFNPDIFLWGFFNFMAFVVSFDFVVKNIL